MKDEMMSPLPLITLGIPLYNAADLIERTLLSVLNQTYPHIEYLFIDDKGDSMDLVRRVVDAHPRKEAVRIIDQVRNQGIAVARNTIVEQARGKYLFTMDCDDVIVPHCIGLLYQKMQEHPVDFVAASFVRCDLAGREYPGCQYVDTLIEGDGHPVVRYRYEEGKSLFVATWNKLYELDFLKKHRIRCQEGHFNEDPWFTYQVILNARSCRLLPDCTLYYTYNPRSVSGITASQGYSERIAHQYVEISQLKCAYIRPLSAKPFYRSLLEDIMMMGTYHAYRIGLSTQLPTTLKKELQKILLTRSFALPTSAQGKRWNVKYLLLSSFFALPTSYRISLINLAVFLRLKDGIKRWIRLK